MRDRLGNLGDVVFGLFMAGIVANAIAAFIPHSHSNGGMPSSSMSLALQTSLIEFIVIIIFWALQSRVISALFVDHFAFLVGYSVMLYWIFGWILFESIIPAVNASIRAPIGLPLRVDSAAFLICMAFVSLLCLAIGGLAYHWSVIGNYRRYERLRDISMILVGVIVTALFIIYQPKIGLPLNLLFIIALAFVFRVGIGMSMDKWAALKWGTTVEKFKKARVEFAGIVLTVFFLVTYMIFVVNGAYNNGKLILFAPAAVVLVYAVFSIKTRLVEIKCIQERLPARSSLVQPEFSPFDVEPEAEIQPRSDVVIVATIALADGKPRTVGEILAEAIARDLLPKYERRKYVYAELKLYV